MKGYKRYKIYKIDTFINYIQYILYIMKSHIVKLDEETEKNLKIFMINKNISNKSDATNIILKTYFNQQEE